MKKIGAMVLLTADAGAEGYGLAMFTRVLGMTPEDSLALYQRTSAEIRNKNYHVWEPFHVAYGRKPLKASEDRYLLITIFGIRTT
ncbi:Similar to hypothetical protein [Tuber melanosporum Mel28]; acc. no. XP_002841796 [Pyronema omphalodes CBS 100304]|uniref:Uncharacterized protein n=1 Tax=Pyronema omphalodes (strain CBS 100304) TaxID=1076935 RepID=U4LG23_PYROM|nr:Similar to hypothetical protein [Tuber melanosporum Mel28]; acc. no. XP_002841796 [Pyronema omphalodes CBS 100304]